MNKKVGKFLIRLVTFIFFLIFLILAVGFLWVKVSAPRSFPQINVEVSIPGLDAPVNIYRDTMGIPNIYATSSHDLFLAQGYIHAQDRFWQMDFWRHIGSARLAEMFPSEVKTDAFLRALGWKQLAEQEYELLEPELRTMLEDYSQGVNAYLSDHSGIELSLEYGILKLLNPSYRPEPWTPVNTLTWAKSMAWDLGGNMKEEINRAILLKTLSADYVNELYPLYSPDHPVIVPTFGENVLLAQPYSINVNLDLPDALLKTISGNIAHMDAVLGPSSADIGSNNWVVSGSLTNTGMPLLANDPHLNIQMPSIWYQVGLHCQPKNDTCPYNVTGFSFAGVPGVVIGHNDRIAWGVTNVGPDVQDLFIEKINLANPNQYEYLGKWVDMDIHKETILVAGGDPVEVVIRSTVHGPIISDSYGPLKQQVETPQDTFTQKSGIDLPAQYAISLRWTALEPIQLFNAIWGFDKAQNWDEFRAAARDFVVPAQNLVYADVEGNIGYQMPGYIPIRKAGDGRLPVPGWTGEYDWQGYIPFEELPFVFNPKSGYIVTANNQVNPWDYPNLITTDWDGGFRAQRIVELLTTAPGSIDIAYFQKIQGDNYDASAATLVPLLLKTDLGDTKLDEIRSILKDWDYQDGMDSAPAALYSAFWQKFLANTFGDDLPADMQPAGSSRWFEVVRNMASQLDSHWWDSQLTTFIVETREDILKLSFSQAVSEIQSTLGKDPSKWRWGDLHTATFQNQTLGKSGVAPIEMLFNRGPFSTSGGASIVNATSWNAAKGFEVTALPSMRMIVDLSDLRNSITVHPTGQSGHAYHPNYIDMAELWRNIQYYPMFWNEQAIVSNAVGHLVLTP
ncbi:MAG: peptidase S45 [Chloroflexi bacterium GWB2_49_20]|nr:MAG: peptidase S45 [Chloroflexi bacterium GWB2_49_20]OGN78989.1 MAG: peptidase S45 [Chloroflexi bacterium GWC2_49_37]OGN86250.1 MAG: peptidase S45 [Chloroflexi bacterium GWD2_49_16]